MHVLAMSLGQTCLEGFSTTYSALTDQNVEFSSKKIVHFEAKHGVSHLLLGILPDHEEQPMIGLTNRSIHILLGVACILSAYASKLLLDSPEDTDSPFWEGCLDGLKQGIFYTTLKNRVIDRLLIEMIR